MAAATTVTQRHVATSTPRSKKTSSQIIPVPAGSLPVPFTPDAPNSNSQWRRRRKRNQAYRTRQPLFWAVGLMVGVVTLTLLGWNTIMPAVPAGSTKSISPPSFQVVSDHAPPCHTLTMLDQIDFTLVTQLSHDRLWMMRHHCQRYPHLISIAVYSNATLDVVQDELTTLGCDLQLVTVTIVDAHKYPADDYPVNLLRNEALAKIETSHLIYLDVDFWTCVDLYETLQSDEIRNALLEDPKLALVLPAFMLFRQCKDYKDCRQNNIPLMPNDKRDVLEMMVKKRGHIFDPTNRGGHGSTLYKDWIRQDAGTLHPISCLQSHRYEPFVVVRWCQDLPPFQTVFNGYGKNKLTWMMQVIRRGYKLSQVGGAFLCHYPHLDSAARTKWNEAPEQLVLHDKKRDLIQIRRPKSSDGDLNLGSFKRGQVDRLFVEFREWLDEQLPDTSRVGMCEKAQDDDSKLWIDKEHDQELSHQQSYSKQAAIQKDNTKIEQEAAAVHGEEGQADEKVEESNDGTGTSSEE